LAVFTCTLRARLSTLYVICTGTKSVIRLSRHAVVLSYHFVLGQDLLCKILPVVVHFDLQSGLTRNDCNFSLPE